MRPPAVLVALVALALAASGCAQEPEPDAPPATEQGPALAGYVFDAALRPIEGASVEVTSANATASTDSQGAYRFEQVPRDVPLLVVVSSPAHLTASKSVSVPLDQGLMVNFTLDAVPVLEPYHDVIKFEGFLPCQLRVAQDGGGSTTECGSLLGQQRNDIWEFAVGPDVAGIVVEIAWEASTVAASILNATVETVGFGDDDAVLAQVEGPSVLRAQVAQAHADKYYPSGGLVRVTVSIGSDADEEAGASAGAAVDQDFEAFASIFYHAPPPATYTVSG